MVDAQHPREPQLLAQSERQRLEAGRFQHHRVERREPPVLALRRKGVGRRAKAGTGGEIGAVGPCLGAMRMGAHGQIKIKPMCHARGFGTALRVGDGPFGGILQPRMEPHPLMQLARGLSHLRAGWILIGRIPCIPIGAELFRQRLMERELLQLLAFVPKPCVKGGSRRRGAKLRLKLGEAGRGFHRKIDDRAGRCGAAGGQVERREAAAVRGGVGAEAAGVGHVEAGVDGVDPEKSRALRSGPFGDHGQIGEAADAALIRRTQAGQRHHQPPVPLGQR